jgi:DnaK suppressor protein
MTEKLDHLDELEGVRKRTLREIARLREQLQAEIEPASADDDDMADVAADIYERGKTISLISSLEDKLHAIEHAIAAATAGSYGICEMCGKTIPEERLQIMPETTLCVQCASKLEQGIRRHRIMTADRLNARRLHEAEEEDDDEEEEEEDGEEL